MGLRTYNVFSPYPEEFNRQAVSILSRYNFAPTQLAADNLIKEGKNPDTIFITGNTVIDAMRHTVIKNYTHPELTWVGENKLIFITAHRRENLGEPMQHIMRDVTERQEGVAAGTLRLVGTKEETIFQTFKELLENEEEYNNMTNACTPYGDGHACERIADILRRSIFRTAEMLDFQGFSPFLYARLSLICRLNLQTDTER